MIKLSAVVWPKTTPSAIPDTGFQKMPTNILFGVSLVRPEVRAFIAN